MRVEIITQNYFNKLYLLFTFVSSLLTMKKYLLCVLLCFGCWSWAFSQSAAIDSALTAIEVLPDDTTKLAELEKLAWKYRNRQTDKALEIGQKALQLSKKLNQGGVSPQLLNYMGVFYEVKGNYPESLQYYFLAIRAADSLKDTKELGFGYNNVANINYRLADYKQAENYSLKALIEFQKIAETRGLGYAYIRLAETLLMTKKLSKAQDYVEKSMAIRTAQKDSSNLVLCYIVFGKIAKAQKNFDFALLNFETARQILKSHNTAKGIANVLNNITDIYITRNQMKEAEILALESLTASEKAGVKLYLKDTYYNLMRIYSQKQDYTLALQYQNLFANYKTEIFDEEKTVLLSALHYKYEYEDELSRFQLLQKKSAQNRLIFAGIVVLGVLLVGFLAYLLRTNYIQRKENYKLKIQQEALNEKNEQFGQSIAIIEEKNESIIASIQYAKRIQGAVLISETKFKDIFAESFVFFAPKDIVSGDFYWAAEKETPTGKIALLAVADCTGHGVAGAFMSLIGCSILDQIIHNEEIHQPDKVLAELHTTVRQLLRTDETESPDGMDISFCLLNKTKAQLQFAGATQSIFVKQQAELAVLKGDRKSIGGVWQEAQQAFTLHTHTWLPNNLLYLFTDGYADQFGGTEHKRYSSKNFKNLIERNSQIAINQQKDLLQTEFENWKGSKYKQMDDVVIIGIKN